MGSKVALHGLHLTIRSDKQHPMHSRPLLEKIVPLDAGDQITSDDHVQHGEPPAGENDEA